MGAETSETLVEVLVMPWNGKTSKRDRKRKRRKSNNMVVRLLLIGFDYCGPATRRINKLKRKGLIQ